MKEWLESVTFRLGTNEPSPKRLGTAVTLTCAIRKLFSQKYTTTFEEDAIIALLRMITLTYETAEKEYIFLKSLMRSDDSKLDQSSMLVILYFFIFTEKK